MVNEERENLTDRSKELIANELEWSKKKKKKGFFRDVLTSEKFYPNQFDYVGPPIPLNPHTYPRRFNGRFTGEYFTLQDKVNKLCKERRLENPSWFKVAEFYGGVTYYDSFGDTCSRDDDYTLVQLLSLRN